MPWQIGARVEHGVVDNTMPGTISGWLWLVGSSEPLVLELEGDCEPDLAGCRLEFEAVNIRCAAPPNEAPDMDQSGTALTFTATARALSSAGQLLPLLRLEWLSELNGRIVADLLAPQMVISEPRWQPSARERRTQRLRSSFAMRCFIARLLFGETMAEDWDLVDLSCLEHALREVEDYLVAKAHSTITQGASSTAEALNLLGWSELAELLRGDGAACGPSKFLAARMVAEELCGLAEHLPRCTHLSYEPRTLAWFAAHRALTAAAPDTVCCQHAYCRELAKAHELMRLVCELLEDSAADADTLSQVHRIERRLARLASGGKHR